MVQERDRQPIGTCFARGFTEKKKSTTPDPSFLQLNKYILMILFYLFIYLYEFQIKVLFHFIYRCSASPPSDPRLTSPTSQGVCEFYVWTDSAANDFACLKSIKLSKSESEFLMPLRCLIFPNRFSPDRYLLNKLRSRSSFVRCFFFFADLGFNL